jgi:hypothetical protein
VRTPLSHEAAPRLGLGEDRGLFSQRLVIGKTATIAKVARPSLSITRTSTQLFPSKLQERSSISDGSVMTTANRARWNRNHSSAGVRFNGERCLRNVFYNPCNVGFSIKTGPGSAITVGLQHQWCRSSYRRQFGGFHGRKRPRSESA